MSGKKTYTVILNSTNATNKSGSSTTSYTYNIQWYKILPQEHQKYDLSWIFRSQTTLTGISDTILVSVDFGTHTTFDQSWNQTNVLGAIIPKSYATNTSTNPRYYYESNYTDDCGCMAYYPQKNSITVNITKMDFSAVSNVPDYILQLCFTVIE